MARQINYSGLVIAVLGFVLTRFTVTLAIYDDPLRFYAAGVLPLALGLGLSAFGVALAVADVDRSLVRTTATWCVIGVVAMFVLVTLTLLGSTTGPSLDVMSVRSRAYLSNFLIGGSVGGTLTGLYAARAQRQRRELRTQANRLSVLNRILRHEVLNAVTAIRGYAELDPEDHPQARDVIVRRSNGIEATIEEVKHLARGAMPTGRAHGTASLETCLTASIDTVRTQYSNADIDVEGDYEHLAVRASDRLTMVFTHLLSNAAVHTGADDPAITVSVTATGRSVRVSIGDDGPGLPANQQALLETGHIEEYDDPNTGFGLNVVRLLVDEFEGAIETHVDGGTTVTVVLPRAETSTTGPRFIRSDLADVRRSTAELAVILGASLAAGVFYGLVSESLGGSIAGIGVFYGTADPLIGWITHEFHSVVFGFMFVALVSQVPQSYRDDLRTYVAVGLGWSVALWIGAAGVIAPLWLRLLGIPAPLPVFSGSLLASHLVWGGSLGLLTAWGYAHVTPWVSQALPVRN